MDQQLKAALKRFAKVVAFAAVGAAAAAVATIDLSSPDTSARVVAFTALNAFIAGAIAGAQKFLTWSHDPDRNVPQ